MKATRRRRARCKVPGCGLFAALALPRRAIAAGRPGARPPIRAQTPRRPTRAQKKSVALAVTLEALSPIAGMGAFYAHDTDRATVLAIVSAVAAGAGVGSAFWLIHLDGQHPTGSNRSFQDAEQGTAITVLATAAIVYVVARDLRPGAGARGDRGVQRQSPAGPRAAAPRAGGPVPRAGAGADVHPRF